MSWTPKNECVICCHHAGEFGVSVDGDMLCHKCIQNIFDEALESERNFPPRWKEEELELEVFIHLLDYGFDGREGYEHEYLKRAAEWNCPGPERIYCGHPGRADRKAQRFIGGRNHGGSSDKLCRLCEICGRYVCISCGRVLVRDVKGDEKEASEGEGPEEVEGSAAEGGDPEEDGGDVEEKDIDAGEEDAEATGEDEEESEEEYQFAEPKEDTIDHHCNPRADQELLEANFEGMVAGVDYQDCPVCDRRGWLGEGCDHVTCICRTHYCYACGEEVDPMSNGTDEEVLASRPHDCPREQD